MSFDKMDAYFIGLTDRLTGRLEAMGVGLPVVMREALTLEMIVLVALPITSLWQGTTITAAFWTICMLVIVPRRLKSWRVLDRDAKAEWTEEMSRRYFSRAERNRQVSTPRRFAWAFLAVALYLVLWSICYGVQELTDALLVAIFTVELVKHHLDCALPQPPQKREPKIVFASA